MNDLPARIDDQLYTGKANPGRAIVVADSIDASSHGLDEGWLRARVRGWMNLVESPDMDFWIGTYTAPGRWIWCASNNDGWAPQPYRQEYARNVVRHLNETISAGGAWLGGWVRGGREFYLLWKDSDGDIQVPIECDKPFIVLAKYTISDWQRHAEVALGVWSEWKRNLELGGKQQVKLAQGERVSPEHEKNAPIF